MLKIVNGMLSLNKTKSLTARQLHTLKGLTDADKNTYMLSLMGLLKGRQYKPKYSRGRDALRKPANSVLSKLRELKDLSLDHKPTAKDVGQWIGVEIECFIPHQSGSSDCTDDCDHDNDICYQSDDYWDENKARNWLMKELKAAGVTRVNVKFDGSLSCDEGHGVECTILFNSAYGFEPLEKLCKVLTDSGCYINRTCGLHVHLDARHLTQLQVKAIGHSIGHTLPVLKWLTPVSRHNNDYCALSVSKMHGGRYHAVNLTAYAKYKTIEIRMHQGSINAAKIKNWIELLKVMGAAKLKTNITTFQELIDLPGMNESLITYAESRITELNNNAWAQLNRFTEVA